MSSSTPLQPGLDHLSTSILTSVVNTSGRRPSISAVWLIWRTAWWALSTRVGEGAAARGAWLHLELGKDGVAEGFGGDAGAVGDEEDGARVHGWRPCPAARRMRAAPTIRPIIQCAPAPPVMPASMHTGACPRAERTVALAPLHGIPRFFNFRSFPMSASCSKRPPWSYRFENLRMTDVESVGGKNASLGEMISQLPHRRAGAHGLRDHGPRVPRVPQTRRLDRAHQRAAGRLNTEDVRALAVAGAEIRAMVENQPFPGRPGKSDPRRVREAERRQCQGLVRGALVCHGRRPARRLIRRPAGDLPQRGRRIDEVLHKMKEVFASLYNDRAISYRVHKGFAHADVALSAGVQRMVRSDTGRGRRDVHDRHRERL
jgi:hypothetical protein